MLKDKNDDETNECNFYNYCNANTLRGWNYQSHDLVFALSADFDL